MRTLRLSLILGAVALLLICLLLFSTHPDSQVYKLDGQVATKNISAVSLNVYITQDPSFPESFDGLFHTQTMQQGKFQAEFHGEINAPFYIYVCSDNSKPVRRVFYPKAENDKDQTIKQPIRFEPIKDGLSSEDYNNGIHLPFYKHECADQSVNQVPMGEIQFFENLLERYCSRHKTIALEGDVYTKNGPIPKAVFRDTPSKQVTDKLPTKEEQEGPGSNH